MRLLFIFFLMSQVVNAQEQYTLDMLIQRAMEVHPAIKAGELEQKQQHALKRASIDLPKTEIMLTYGQYNSIIKNDNNITISQTLPFPTVWKSQHMLFRESATASELKTEAIKNEMVHQVKMLYQSWLYYNEYHRLMQKQDSVYATLLKTVTVRYNVGEGTLLEKTAIETQYSEIQNALKQSEAIIENTKVQLQLLAQIKAPIAREIFAALPFAEGTGSSSIEQNPAVKYRKQQAVVATHQKKVERNRALPDITVGYFTQTLIGPQTIDGQERYFNNDKRFDGFIVGISIPLWFGTYSAKIKSAEYNRMAIDYEAQAYAITVQQQQGLALQGLEKSKNALAYYEQSALPNAMLLEQQSLTAFKNGEIDYATFLLNLRQALTIRQNYLQALYEFNQSIIQLEYLNGSLR